MKFNKAISTHLKKLQQFVPVVARVHGKTHPSLIEIKSVFDELTKKIKDSNQPNIDNEFFRLRELTNNYTSAGDACQTYDAVFEMLSILDKAYFNSKE